MNIPPGTIPPPPPPVWTGGAPTQLDRIEAKLDALLDALAEEQEEDQPVSLDGEYAGSERDQSQPL